MEARLREYDEELGERGWRDVPFEMEWFIYRLMENVGELAAAVRNGIGVQTKAVDVANFAMFIHDCYE